MKNQVVQIKASTGLVAHILAAPLLLAFIVASNTPAAAQAINYGALEDIFEEPVTTSATGTPQRASEVAADMTIITADQIRQAGSRTIPDILGIYVPGVNILQEGINQYDVGMRGYQAPYNSRLLVLIDGRQVFIDDYSRTQWDNLPVNIDNIRQIEVVKGASSALFGSNATSGVVNIITYSPLYDNNNVVSAQIGTQHAYQGDGTMTQKTSTFGGIKISAGGMREREYSATAIENADFAGTTTHPHHEYVDASGVFKVSPSFILNTEFSASQKDGNEVIPTYDSFPVRSTNFSARAGWQWKSSLGTIKNDNYVNQNSNLYEPGDELISGDPIRAYTTNSLIVSRIEDMFDVGASNTFRLMAEYRHKYNINTNTNFHTYEKPVLNEDVYTLGGTWLWRLRDDLSWTNAGRYDINHTAPLAGVLDPASPYTPSQYKRQYATFSANSGLVYNVTDKDTLRATYGRGVQNPSLINTGDNFNFYLAPAHFPFPTSIARDFSDPNLKPTIVQDYGLGYDRKITDIYSTAHFTPFYESSRDLIALTNMSYEPSLGFDQYGAFGPILFVTQHEANVGGSHGFGGEVSIDGQNPSGYRWGASYSYAKIHDNALAAQYNNYQGSAPRNQVRLNLGRTIGKWELDGHGQYMTESNMLRTITIGSAAVQVPVKDYFTFGGRIGYHVTDNITVALSGTNLTSMRTVENPYTVVQRRIFVGVTGSF